MRRLRVLLSAIRSPIAIVMVALAGCGDYAISLPNHYKIVRLCSGTYCIGKESGTDLGKIVVGIRVENYAVVGSVVTGFLSQRNLPPDPPKELVGTEGYFILNTDTGDVRQGLSEKEWDEALKALGITSRPSLRKPSRWDAE